MVSGGDSVFNNAIHIRVVQKCIKIQKCRNVWDHSRKTIGNDSVRNNVHELNAIGNDSGGHNGGLS